MSEYIIWESDKTETTDNLGMKHGVSHFEKREEIVRCRDCKYTNEDGDECVYFAAWEPLPEGDEFRDVYVDVEPNGFCAWAERREP